MVSVSCETSGMIWGDSGFLGQGPYSALRIFKYCMMEGAHQIIAFWDTVTFIFLIKKSEVVENVVQMPHTWKHKPFGSLNST